METSQHIFKSPDQVLSFLENFQGNHYQLNIVFADVSYFENAEINRLVEKAFAGSILMACSSSGEISTRTFHERSFVLTSVNFKDVRLKKVSCDIAAPEESTSVGQCIANQLKTDDLKHVFLLADGVTLNGTRFVEGINSILGSQVNVSGGLASDNANFTKTYVADNDNRMKSNCVSGLGFYGEHIHSGCGSYGGWDSFGKDRIVNKSKENIVYEIDGQPALELYKTYLGPKAAELPAAALFFPLEIRKAEDKELLVRTIIGVNEADQSLTFAGNIPEGSQIRLMKTNVNRVIDGAEKAAIYLNESVENASGLVLMVSCIGRKLVLSQLTQDEVDAVCDQFPEGVVFTGFYSNGELSKVRGHENCNLHNQTMTLTGIVEK